MIDSKKIALIFIFNVVFLLKANITFSQEIKMTVIHFDCTLESILQLNIDPDAKIEFGMKEINDNLFQITKYPEPVIFSVDATNNWNLVFSTLAENFSGLKDSSLKIPVNFIGYTIESYGTNFDNGDFSNIINITKDTLLPLSSKKRLVLKNGRKNNIGGSQQNYFIIRWDFFDESDHLKIIKQSDFDMANDYFSVGLKLTLSENLTIDSNQ